MEKPTGLVTTPTALDAISRLVGYSVFALTYAERTLVDTQKALQYAKSNEGSPDLARASTRSRKGAIESARGAVESAERVFETAKSTLAKVEKMIGDEDNSS